MAAFTAGDLVVYRVGTGGAALSGSATAVFLDEYTASGTLVQSIALPTADSGANQTLTASGSATSEGLITTSADGRYLLLTGYDTAPGTASVAGTTSAAVNRVIGRVDASGTVDTTTALTDFSSGNNPRSVASVDGTSFYVDGGASGIRYATLGATTSTQLSTTLTNLRQAEIYDGQLYVSTSSGSAVRIGTVGTGLPTTAGQTISNLSGFTTTGSPYAFFLADLSSSVAGVDTLYVAEDGTGTGANAATAGVYKYSLVGGSWMSNGFVADTAVRGLTGSVSGTTVSLFATSGSSANQLDALSDTSGYNATINATVNHIATAASNTAFRGVAFAPQAAADTTAPTLTTKSPADEATGIDKAANIVLTFNEAVKAGGGNVVISDGAGDTRSIAIGDTTQITFSSDGKTVTINPTADLNAGDTYHVTIGSGVITDTAGNAYAGLTSGDLDFTTSTTVTPATLSIAATSATKAEGFTGATTPFTFTVTRSGDTSTETSVHFAVTGSGANPADASDFSGGTLPSGDVSFAANETSKLVTINVAGDTTIEPDETFTVTLSTPTNGAVLGTSTATGTIQNDDAAYTPIYTIQGSGATSPLVGQTVTTQGVVTAVDTNGYFIQDQTGDGNAATSDGVFVFTSSAPSGIAVGNLVSVTGKVQEFTASGSAPGSLSVTEIGNVTATTVLTPSVALPAAIVIGGPGGLKPPAGNLTDGNAFFESLEGMLVKIVAPLVTGPTNSFGEIFTVANNGADASGLNSRGDLLITGGSASFGNNDSNGGDFNPERIQIDPGLGQSTPQVSVGAKLNDVTGIVNYSFGNYEVLATSAVTVATPSPLVKTGTSLTGDSSHLLYASYNAENFSVSGSGNAKLQSIADEILTKLNAPGIIGLQEIQDNSGPTDNGVTSADQNLQAIVNAINAKGGPQYAYVDNPFIGNDTNGGQPGGNIRTAFLYRTDQVSFVAGSARTIAADGSAITDKGSAGADAAANADQQTNANNPFFGSRPPLAADFMFNGQKVTVVNNHFTSKGGSGALMGSTQPSLDAGEVQRAGQAQAVNTFVDSLLSVDPNARVIVGGDLNDFGFEQPLSVLRGTATATSYSASANNLTGATATYTPGGTAVLTDLESTLPENQRFDYVFEGNAETLDHLLASASLASSLQFQPVHINSEFVDQTSDHDPLTALFAISPTLTNQQTVSGVRSFTVPSGGGLSVATGPAILWDLTPATTGTNATVDNSGAITAGSGRAIDTTGTQNGNNHFTLQNRSGASISAPSDVFRIAGANATNGFPGAVIDIENAGSLTSTANGYVLDFTPVTATSASVTINNKPGTASGDGMIKASASHDAIRLGGGGTTVIDNAGTIDATAGAFRAINVLEYDAVVSLTLTNERGGTIQSQDDAIRITTASAATVGTGTVLVDNSGTIRATGSGQAIDLNDVNTTAGKLVIRNEAAGVITAANNDGVRPGQNGSVENYGQITSNAAAAPTSQPSADGIDFQDNHTGSVHNFATGVISGARHGITSGVNGSVTVLNDAGGTITGRDGSGVGSDGAGSVTNFGTITGTVDTTSGRGDGDGVDVDFTATVVNYGTIQGLGAKGNDSGGRTNAGEGISIGGGSIENHGLIRASSTTLDGAATSSTGGAIVVNNDGNTNRSGNASTTIANLAGATISSDANYAIRLENKGSDAIDTDTITNYGTITGNGTIPDPTGTATFVDPADGMTKADPNSVGTLDGITYAGTGSARFIKGDGSAIQMGEGNDTLTNYGTITGNTGRALSLEGGNDTLNLYTGATITGRIDGGTGTDTLNLLLDDRTGQDATLGANSGATSGTLANVVNFEALAVKGGTWTVQDAQAYASGIAISTGAALIVGAAGSLSGAIANAGMLTFAHSGDLTETGTISGAGAVTQAGTGSLVLSGANTYGGGTIISSGILDLSGPTVGAFGAITSGAAGTGTISFAAGAQTLRIEAAALGSDAGHGFANTIAGFAADGDVIDVRGIGSASARFDYASDTLTLVGAANATLATLHLTGSYNGKVFVAADDGNGGTQITLLPNTTAPTATSTAANVAANATSATYAVHFSEAVNGVDTADFALTKGGTASGTVASVSGSGQDYTVTVAAITGTGSLALALASGATITDQAGNPIVPATGLTASSAHSVDRDAPAAPVVSLTSDTGASASDHVTNDARITVSGQENGASLRYVVDGGAVSATYIAPTAQGAHTVSVTQTDTAGNVSTAGSLSFTLDTVAPAAPAIALAHDTGISATDKITSDASLTITPAESGGSLSYAVDGNAVASYDPTKLSQGGHTVSVTQTDAAGNTSAAGSLSFTLDRAAPAAVADTASGTGYATTLTDNVLTNDSDGSALHVSALQFAGGLTRILPTGGSVTLDGAHGSLTLSADGSYSYHPTSSGSDVFTYSVADVAGNASSTTLSLAVGAPPAPPASQSFAFAFTDAHLDFSHGHDLMTTPTGAVIDVTGISTLNFTDGTVQEADGSPLVDDLFYYANNLDVWRAHVDPDQHYEAFGWKEGRDPNAEFSTKGYLAANPDVAAAGVNPLQHYDTFGWKEGRSPGPNFSAEAYLNQNPDVANAKVDPLLHYLSFGQKEGRAIYDGETRGADGHHFYGDFDADFYLAHNPDVAAAASVSGVSADSFAYTHYLTFGWHEGRDPDALFSTRGYLSANPDVAAAGTNPLLQYETTGWHQGRDPGPNFHTNAYLAANPDVAAAQIDPLGHYLKIGFSDGHHLA